jgi:hypothetical protein
LTEPGRYLFSFIPIALIKPIKDDIRLVATFEGNLKQFFGKLCARKNRLTAPRSLFVKKKENTIVGPMMAYKLTQDSPGKG